MARKILRRTPRLAAFPEVSVQLWPGKNVNVDMYAEQLHWRARNLFEIAAQSDTADEDDAAKIREKFVKALMCGRILGVNEQDVAERTWYCAIPTLCPVCRARDARKRASQLSGDLLGGNAKRLTHVILTMPEPTSSDEERDQFVLAKFVRPKLSKQLNVLAVRELISGCHIIGLHPSQRGDSSWFSGHFHVLFGSRSASDCREAVAMLQNCWRNHVDSHFARKTHCSSYDIRLSRADLTSDVPNKDRNSHAYNLLAYVQRPFNDSCASDEHQARCRKLLCEVGIKRMFWCSRSKGEPRKSKKRSTFPAAELGKSFIIGFPLKGEPFSDKPHHEHDAAKQLRQSMRDAIDKENKAMARQPKHPLNPYATFGDWHVEEVTAIAADLANPKASTAARLRVAKAFYERIIESIGQRFAWANRWTREIELYKLADNQNAPELYQVAKERFRQFVREFPSGSDQRPEIVIERLIWQNALSEAIRKQDGKHPDATPAQAFDLIEQFHHYPMKLGRQSLINTLRKQFPTLTYDHLTRLQFFAARRLTLTTPLRDSLAIAKDNEQVCHEFAHRAEVESMTPKKLENAIKRAKGARGAGRPPKRK